MSYLDELLANNEQVMLKANRHVIFVVLHTVPYLLGVVLLWVLALLAFLFVPTIGNVLGIVLLVGSLLPLVVAIMRFMAWRAEEYIVTSYRILQLEGIVNKRTFDSALDMVNDVETTQSVVGRFFGFGTIHVITGSEVGINYLAGIDQPYAFKRALLEAKVAYGQEQRRRREPEQQSAPGYPNPQYAHPAYGGYYHYPTPPMQPTPVEQGGGQQPESVRLVMALTELRNAGLLSESEFEAKMRQATAAPDLAPEMSTSAYSSSGPNEQTSRSIDE